MTSISATKHANFYAMSLEKVKSYAGFVLVIGLGMSVQMWAALQRAANFDGDEAVWGLMARHILQGRIPTYAYGQTYLGSLDVIISAAFMRWLGTSVPAFRASSVLLFGVFLLLYGMWVHRLWGRRVALISLFVLALPGPGILWWTFRPFYVFGTMSIVGIVALLLFQSQSKSWLRRVRWVALGVLAGLGLWIHPMTIVYFTAIAVVYWLQSLEWSTLYKRLSKFCRSVVLIPLRELAPVITLGAGGLLVMAFFTGGCEPRASFATAQTVARMLLLGMGGGLGLAALQVSTRRKQIMWGGLGLASGFALGNLPQWKAWLFFGVAPSTAILPSCPTEALPRARLEVEQLVPVMWGMPPLTTILQLPPLQIVLWSLVGLVTLIASVAFIWTGRTALWSLVAMSPLSDTDWKVTVLGLLFGFPLALAVLGSNTINVASVRYLLITWQASAVILALALSRLATKFRVSSLFLIGLWALQVGLGNLADIGRLWQARRDWYSPEAVSTLEEFLVQNNAPGGYADYWIAYPLDYLTEERLTIAPYNADRYPAYSAKVATLPVRAYLFLPGAIPSQASGIEDLARGLRLNEGAGPASPWILENLDKQVVLARQRVSNWDVWLLGSR